MKTNLSDLQGVTSKGGRFLEGPVSGSKKPAEDGQLIILAAGEKVIDKFFARHLSMYFHDHSSNWRIFITKSYCLRASLSCYFL